jgi:hypothetical protein
MALEGSMSDMNLLRAGRLVLLSETDSMLLSLEYGGLRLTMRKKLLAGSTLVSESVFGGKCCNDASKRKKEINKIHKAG